MKLNTNIWKLAIRNLIKQKRITILNIVGLAFGFAAVLFLSAFVYRELTYDSFHEDADKIFKPEFEIVEANADIDLASNVTLDQISLFRENVPGIKAISFLNYSRWDWDNGAWIEYQDNKFNIDRLAFSDQSFSDIFSFKARIGNLKEALNEPNKLVLTKELTDKIFGVENPVGKEVLLNNKPIVIGAVLEEIPSNSSIVFGGLVSYKSASYFFGNEITDWSNIPFIRIEENAFPEQVAGSFSKVLRLSLPEEELKKINPVFHTTLVPIRDLYFHEASAYSPMKHGNKSTAYILLAIGLLILFLAVINYNNLLLATSLKWRKDFGIQQILGADKSNVKKQLFIKGCIITFAGFIVAILLTSIGFRWFNQLINYPLEPTNFKNPVVILIALCILLVTILFSGLIPSLLGGYSNPLTQVQGMLTKKNKYSVIWKGMVTFQLFVSIALITGALVISKQINYGLSKDLGINVKNIVSIPTNKLGEKQQAYLDVISQHAQTHSVCQSTSYINTFNVWGGKLKAPGFTTESILYNMIRVNSSFIETLGLKLVNGRNFRKNNVSDEGSIIVNEAFVKHFKLENPLEATVRDYPIIGVVEDYNFNSLHYQIEPAILWNTPDKVGLSSIHFSANNKTDVGNYLSF